MKVCPRWLTTLLLPLFVAGAAFAVPLEEDMADPAIAEATRYVLDRIDPTSKIGREVQELRIQVSDAEAAKRFLSHLETRNLYAELLPPLERAPGAVDRARDVLEDRFLIQGITSRHPRRPDGGLDWDARGPRDDPEWAWLLNRHDFFGDLLIAYEETGDPVFVLRLDALVRDWILSNPYPDRLTFSAQWRALEVARRVLNAWLHAFYRLSGDEHLSDGTRLLMLRSLDEHADALRHHASFWGGNHLLTEKTALATLAAAFPEFAESDERMSYAIDRTREELLSQTYPDGAFKELTNHYQRVVLVNAQQFIRVMRAAGITVKGTPLYDRIEAMWDYFAGVMRPSGQGPLNSASDLEQNSFYLPDAADFYDRPDWLRYLDPLPGDVPSEPHLQFFPWAGHAVLRSGSGRTADWLFFDAGPHGTAHQHDDRLHLSLDLDGRPFLSDAGRYIYQPGPWSAYFKGPKAHNVVLQNGEPVTAAPREVSKPLPIFTGDPSGALVAAAEASFPGNAWTGRGPARHHRTVIGLFPERWWIVVDDLTGFGAREIVTLWHFHPDVSMAEVARAMVWNSTEQPGQTTITSYQGQEKPFVAGFFSPSYNVREPALEQHFIQRATGPIRNVWFFRSPWMANASGQPMQIEILESTADFLHLKVQEGAQSAQLQLTYSKSGPAVELKRVP